MCIFIPYFHFLIFPEPRSNRSRKLQIASKMGFYATLRCFFNKIVDFCLKKGYNRTDNDILKET